ncbi:MAG: putative Fe/S biosis protein NfuA [Actinomycetota bacterium]
MSPLAPQSSDTIIEITEEALAQLLTLRDEEPEKERLGLRLEVIASPGEEFKYDLSFEIVTQAAFSDEVRTIGGLKIIVPLQSFEHINGAVLDYSERQGLIIRNPNKPPAAVIEGLINDDETSAAVEAVISTDINPSLAAHGGYVTFVGHDGEGIAYLTMGGGCHGCSMSKMTMLEGVQTTLVEQVPAIAKVRDITDHTTGANPYYS